MNSLFSQGEDPADEQDLETDDAPDEGTAPEDEEQDEEASGGEDADPEDEETSTAAFKLPLKVSGKEIVIESQEEAIELAQKGMHYTQEMQRLRDEQQKWTETREQERGGLRQQVDQYKSALQSLHDTYGFVLGKEAPDWASTDMQKLRTEKPNDYLALREQWDQMGAIRTELSRIEQENQKESEKQFKSWVTKEQAALAEKRPEWTDATRRQQDWGLIQSYAAEQGISDQEISNLYDHRFWMILHDAARYRQAEAAGKKKVAATTRTVEPGSGKNVNQGERRFRQERSRLKESGDVRAAGNILQELMTRKK
jgi:hypothetical protein